MKNNLLVSFCFVGIIFISLASVFSSWIFSHSPYAIYEDFLTLPPFWMDGGSLQFPLGTDDLGRDLMIRLLYGGKISLLVGGVVMIMSLVFGLIFGMVAAVSKRAAPWIMGMVDIFMSFPGILIAIVVVAILGPGLFNACLAASLMCLPLMIRLVRSLALREMGLPYVESSRSFGAGTPRLVVFHILPNCLGEISVQSVLNFSEGILTVAALSFLGLGAEPPLPEWGVMISDGRAYIQNAWWLICFPGLCLLVLVLCVNIIGERLRDFFDPRLSSQSGSSDPIGKFA
ncbi:MAG: ABC transporter permease subunit [Bdellovibrionales bacterium]|nr:ABC transporter permease subunit [Bdellovibrionales bacterium]